LEKKVKLRTYKRIKRKLRFAPYLNFKSRQCRRFLTQLRSGSNFLRIEKGRYQGEEIEERVCKYCNKVEDEEHFLLDCELYKDIRQTTFKSLKVSDQKRDVILSHMMGSEKYDADNERALTQYIVNSKSIRDRFTELIEEYSP